MQNDFMFLVESKKKKKKSSVVGTEMLVGEESLE